MTLLALVLAAFVRLEESILSLRREPEPISEDTAA
jgi:hypothetical protein